MMPPITARIITCVRYTANTVRPEAPSAFRVAIEVAAAVEMALDRVADADAADQQRGQADDGEELREALDIALKLRRGVAARADLPAGLRQLDAGVVGGGGDIGVARCVRRQAQPVMPARQAAGLDEAARRQRALADHQPRAEADAAGELVGLARERRAHDQMRVADGERVARLETEALRQSRIDRRAVDAVVLGERGIERALRIELGRAEQRIGVVDGLDLDQGRAAVGHARHRPQGRRARHVAVALEEVQFLLVRLPRDQREGEVAAEDDAALPRQAVGKTGGKRADAGDGHGAERDAGDEHVEAAQARAHLAQREAQGEAVLPFPSPDRGGWPAGRASDGGSGGVIRHADPQPGAP